MYRGGSELSASYWSFLGCIARARVEWGYVRRGRRWERKGMDGTREEEAADLTIWWGESSGGARPLHCGGVGLQLDGAVSLTCLRNPPAPCAGDLRAHPRRQRVPLLKSPSGPKQTLLSPNDRGSRAFEMLTLLPLDAASTAGT